MVQKNKPSSNYDFFLKMDTSKYKGEWIAIAKNKIVAHGKDAQKVYQIAKKRARKTDVSLAKSPDEQMLVLLSNIKELLYSKIDTNTQQLRKHLHNRSNYFI